MDWQPIEMAPTHRRDVLIMSIKGRVGIGWFSQLASGSALNVEYISRGDLKLTLEEEIAAGYITHWMPLPKPPKVSGE